MTNIPTSGAINFSDIDVLMGNASNATLSMATIKANTPYGMANGLQSLRGYNYFTPVSSQNSITRTATSTTTNCASTGQCVQESVCNFSSPNYYKLDGSQCGIVIIYDACYDGLNWIYNEDMVQCNCACTPMGTNQCAYSHTTGIQADCNCNCNCQYNCNCNCSIVDLSNGAGSGD